MIKGGHNPPGASSLPTKYYKGVYTFPCELSPLAFTNPSLTQKLEAKLTSPSKAVAASRGDKAVGAISCVVAAWSPSAGLRLQQLRRPLEGGDYPQCQGPEAGNALLPCPCGGNVGFLHPWRALSKPRQAPKHLSKQSVVSMLSLGRSDLPISS